MFKKFTIAGVVLIITAFLAMILGISTLVYSVIPKSWLETKIDTVNIKLNSTSKTKIVKLKNTVLNISIDDDVIEKVNAVEENIVVESVPDDTFNFNSVVIGEEYVFKGELIEPDPSPFKGKTRDIHVVVIAKKKGYVQYYDVSDREPRTKFDCTFREFKELIGK